MKSLFKSNLLRGIILLIVFFVSTHFSIASNHIFSVGDTIPSDVGWVVTYRELESGGGTSYVVRNPNEEGQYRIIQQNNDGTNAGVFSQNEMADFRGRFAVSGNLMGNFWAQQLQADARPGSRIEVFEEQDEYNRNDLYVIQTNANGRTDIIYFESGAMRTTPYNVSTVAGVNAFLRDHGEEFDETNSKLENFVKELKAARTDDEVRSVGRGYERQIEDGAFHDSGGRLTRLADRGKNLFWGALNKVLVDAMWVVALFFLAIGSIFLWICTLLLNFIIYTTIYNISTYIGDSSSVSAAWEAFRDLANIGFIFILLYISISTILQMGGTNTKQLLGRVVITALMLNFSLFFTKVIIDTSNILALSFYNQISIDGANGVTRSESREEAMESGIGGAFFKQLGITSIYKSENVPDDALGILMFGFMGMIVMIVTGIAFISAAAILFSRLIMLIIYTITSPIAFISLILPGTKKIGSQWIQGMIGQALVAPVFFIMMWVTFTILKTVQNTDASTLSWQKVFGGGEGAEAYSVAQFLMNYLIVIGMLVVSIWITRQTSKMSGGLAVSVMNKTSKVMGVMGGSAFGVGAWAARGTIGWGAQALANKQSFRTATEKSGWRGGIARLAYKGTKGVANSNLDVRSATGISSIIGASGVDVGTGRKGGFTQVREEAMAKKAKSAQVLPSSKAIEEDINSPINILTLGGRGLRKAVENARKEQTNFATKKGEIIKDHRNDSEVIKATADRDKENLELKKLEMRKDAAIRDENDKKAEKLVVKIEKQRKKVEDAQKEYDKYEDRLKEKIEDLTDSLTNSKNKQKTERSIRDIIKNDIKENKDK